MQTKRQEGGFTLAELLIVMAIIVVLAAVAIPTFGRQLETARESGDMEVLRNIYTEALTMATLDAMDGQFDGKNGDMTVKSGDTFTGFTIISSDGKTTKGKVTANLKTMQPNQGFTQGQTGWQYVNGTVSGVAPTGNPSKSTTDVIYQFEIASGDLLLKSVTCS